MEEPVILTRDKRLPVLCAPWAILMAAGASAQCEIELTAGDGAAGHAFGSSVALAGDVAIVGARGATGMAPNSGAAYVYRFAAGVWTEEAKLVATSGAMGDDFGRSVAIADDVAVVGAPGADLVGSGSGAAYVFTHSGGVWTQQQVLVGADTGAFDSLGADVALAGDVIVLGARRATPGGAAYVFRAVAGSWLEETKLIGSDTDAGDDLGLAVAISGERVVVGAPDADSPVGNRTGAAYAFVDLGGGVWFEEQKFSASDGVQGENFGAALACSGTSVWVGAPRDDDLGIASGSAYAFELAGGAWSEVQKIFGADTDADDAFGTSVSISASTVLVGAPGRDDGALQAGAAYAFVRVGPAWSQEHVLSAPDPASGDDFGFRAALDHGRALVGAPVHGHTGARTGAAFLLPAVLVDCNQNGVPDVCDLLLGASDDCNQNDVPDECDLVGPVLLLADFDGSAPPPGVVATSSGLWHTTTACAPAGTCGSGAFHYFGLDGSCTYETGGQPSGYYTLSGVQVPGNVTDLRLRYCSAYRSESGFDRGMVLVNGVEVEYFTGPGPVEWSEHSNDLSQFAGQIVDIRFFFQTIDSVNNDYYGWALDDVRLTWEGSSSPDCNGNSIPDECDVAAGTSADLNANLVPDECETVGSLYCAPNSNNSTGAHATLQALGSASIGDNRLDVVAAHLPLHQFGYLLTSQTLGLVPFPGGSQGILCLGGSIARFSQQVFDSGTTGIGPTAVDVTRIPLSPPVAVAVGDTWRFQVWYRDVNPNPTSNFSDALLVTFVE